MPGHHEPYHDQQPQRVSGAPGPRQDAPLATPREAATHGRSPSINIRLYHKLPNTGTLKRASYEFSETRFTDFPSTTPRCDRTPHVLSVHWGHEGTGQRTLSRPGERSACITEASPQPSPMSHL